MEHLSFWIASTPSTQYPPLARDLDVDVAVIGGGIVGLTTAYYLAREGVSVAVLEARRIGEGVTGHTTGKLTAGQGTIYSKLVEQFDEDKARIYAGANQRAIEEVAGLVEAEAIECDFERTSHTVFAETEEQAGAIESEAETAQRLGLRVTRTSSVPLPIDIAAGVTFHDQAQFHARKFLLALAERVIAHGGEIVEQTRVTGVDDGDPCVVESERGEVRARRVVCATHLPFLDRGAFFAKTKPFRSYVMAAPLEGESPEGMFLSVDGMPKSLRTTPYEGGRLLLAVGPSHEAGRRSDTEVLYDELEQRLRSTFGISDLAYRWSTQDYTTLDQVPYIGRLLPASERIYTATGFAGWGLTHGVISALLITDLVAGRANPWHDLYDATRLNPRLTVKKLIETNLSNVQLWIKERVTSEKLTPLEDIAPGDGGLTEIDGDRAAVYRDEDGVVHRFSPSCTHQGCIVTWNRAETSWDCPCHGSRFAATGDVLHGPAVRPLIKKGDGG